MECGRDFASCRHQDAAPTGAARRGRNKTRRLQCGARPIECADDRPAPSPTLPLFPEDRCAGIAPDTRSSNFACRTCGYAGRANGAPVGSPGSCGGSWNSTGSGRPATPSSKGTQWDQPAGAALVPPDRPRAASGSCIAIGSARVPWPTCWRPTSDWQRRTSFTPAMTFCCGTKRICFHISWRVGATCSVRFRCAALRSDQHVRRDQRSEVAEGDKRRHGYSRDKRPDCPQLVIALVVTTDGLPLAYEVLPANTAIARRCGCSWPGSSGSTAARGALEEGRASDRSGAAECRQRPPPHIGTPKAHVPFEKQLLTKPCSAPKRNIPIKLLQRQPKLWHRQERRSSLRGTPMSCAG